MMSTPPKILVINCGSSSLKFALLAGEDFLAEGIFEKLGNPGASARWKIGSATGTAEYPNANHQQALIAAVELLESNLGRPMPLDAVGHRVVHGGEHFDKSVRIDYDVLAKIESCRDLAPLHNPAHALGIRVAKHLFPQVPHVAVFDTAFHQSMPTHAWMYALPPEMYRRYAVRRYGAHGTSHAYVASQAATLLGRPLEEVQLITAHLGNGCSLCAVRDGLSHDTTMGLTPLEGLMMGTRSGDIDANIFSYLRRVAGMPTDTVTQMLNHRSGLLGVSGVSNDMRAVVQAADEGYQMALTAIDLFCYRLAKGVLSMAAALDRIDALVFTGGIGENNARVRAHTLEFLRLLQPKLDPARNSSHGRESDARITADDSPLTCLVVPTSEERAIARQAAEFV
jgi:acetate kinase